MSKVPGKVPFTQKTTAVTASSTGKHPGKLGFKQPNHGTGKTSAKKSPGKVPFTQKTAAKTGSSTAKNPGKASFKQPASSVAMPKESSNKSKVANAPLTKAKFRSVDDILKHRKERYGI